MSKNKSFVLSTEAINSYRMRVMSAGIKTETFLTNPVMLYMHQRGSVIGKWENLRIENAELIGDADFDLKDEDAAKIAGKVDRGYIKAVSIGVRITAYRFEKESDGEEEILIIDECELTEVSIVDIPSNKAALKLYDNADNEIDLSSGFVGLKASLGESPKPKNTNMDLKAMAKIFGLAESATEEQVLAAANKAQNEAGEHAKLQEKIADDQKKRALALVDAAVAEKRLDATKKEVFLKLAENDFALFEDTLAALPKPVSLKDIATGKETPVGGAAQLADRKDWKFEDWRKKDPNGLIKLQSESWDTFAALYKAEYGEEPEKD